MHTHIELGSKALQLASHGRAFNDAYDVEDMVVKPVTLSVMLCLLACNNSGHRVYGLVTSQFWL